MLRQIAFEIEKVGGRAFLVGGSVRDGATGTPSKDFDVEVFGMHRDDLLALLSRFGKLDMCGESFGVIKMWAGGQDFDFSLPRRDSKSGRGHKGFVPEFSDLTPREAAERRDFTWNGMMQDIITGEVFDFFGGMDDIESHTIRAISDEHFGDDPLRVLRGMQFAARFEMSVERHTAEMCAQIVGEFSTLSIERVWIEWEKWAQKGVRPSFGLRFLMDTTWIMHFPEIAGLVGLRQERAWHPEGDAFEHTCQAVDVAAQIATRESLSDEDRMVLVFAALCHDFGKVFTTEFVDGRVRTRGHDDAGEEPTRSFMAKIGAPSWLAERVVPLVREHMCFIEGRPSARAVRRLSVRLGSASIQELAWVMEADQMARGPASRVRGIVREMVTWAEQEHCQEAQVQPILMGRHLIEMGMKPSREFGVILSAAFEAQLDGEFADLHGAMEWTSGFMSR